MVRRSPRPQPGQVIGRWRIIRPLGEGGTSHTFLVHPVGGSEEDLFVLKRLKQEHELSHPIVQLRARFRGEVAALNTLEGAGCPRIVRVLDCDLQPSDGEPWYVMPYYRAGPMRRGRAGEFLQPYQGNIDRVLTIAEQLAETLAFAHNTGYVHRDVKTANVFFAAPDGEPILGDFGLVYGDDRPPEAETQPGEAVGPGAWRPPELRIGGSKLQNPTSDTYMLGGLIYEGLSGGRTIEETETDQGFTHETADFSLAPHIGNDPRLPYVNALLRNTLRRNPTLRLTAKQLAAVCRSIREWREAMPAPAVGDSSEEAKRAAEEYMRLSGKAGEEKLLAELSARIARLVARLGNGSWAPHDQVTSMYESNAGDTNPLREAKAKMPGAVWWAVRVTAALEAAGITLMSYIFLGRVGGEEIVAARGPGREWQELRRGPAGDPAHDDVIIGEAKTEMDRLLQMLTKSVREAHRK